MSSDLYIIPECYADTLLVESLAHPKQGYNHQKGSGTVGWKMQTVFQNQFALGIIDKDEKTLDYLKNHFKLVIQGNEIQLWRHKEDTIHQWIIQICPELEPWLLKRATESGLTETNFSFLTNRKSIDKRLKSLTSKRDQEIRNFYNELIRRNNPIILKLQSWIIYLKQKQYLAIIEDIERF